MKRMSTAGCKPHFARIDWVHSGPAAFHSSGGMQPALENSMCPRWHSTRTGAAGWKGEGQQRRDCRWGQLDKSSRHRARPRAPDSHTPYSEDSPVWEVASLTRAIWIEMCSSLLDEVEMDVKQRSNRGSFNSEANFNYFLDFSYFPCEDACKVKWELYTKGFLVDLEIRFLLLWFKNFGWRNNVA